MIVPKHFLTFLNVTALFVGTLAIIMARADTQPSPSAPPNLPDTPQVRTETSATTPTTAVTRAPSPSAELNTLLMHATFLVSGPAAGRPGSISFGTIFVMGIPYNNNPKIAHVVVVTAAHVLDGIGGDNAFLQLRRRSADGTYTTFEYQLPIRNSGEPLYVKHPTADVAAMYADLPDEVPMTGLAPDSLVTDKTLDDIEVHPGDEAFTLGFPAAVSLPGGFPYCALAISARIPWPR